MTLRDDLRRPTRNAQDAIDQDVLCIEAQRSYMTRRRIILVELIQAIDKAIGRSKYGNVDARTGRKVQR